MTDVLRGQRQVDLGVLVRRISVHILEVRACGLERGNKSSLQVRLLRRKARQALAAVDKYIRQGLVAVDVEKGGDADFSDRGADVQHLGTALGTRREPLAIDEHDHVAASCDDVDFADAGAKPSCDDAIALGIN